MKSVDCDVIKDLLPSYIDKILSDSSNKLVEEHLQKCENCKETLMQMDKKIYNEVIEGREKQIDYLKGYRKNKIITIIFTIIVTINIIIGSLLLLHGISTIEFNVDVNDVQTSVGIEEGMFEEERFTVSLSSEKFIILCNEKVLTDESGNKILYLKTFGKFSSISEFFNKDKKPRTTQYEYSKDEIENIDKIYIQDKKENTREIWNKQTSINLEQ